MFKVRVRNFQSIKDASIKVDGLTVVTGANNSGKTALMRAIRGVFENSPYGSLLRKDEDKITVDIEFGDGQNVTWEKGPKDNAYIINGYKIAGVGRGAPEELKDLGIFPIVAANNLVWPQIASQFDGTIFLLNRSGAVLAEALSDVEKVGKLTSALRLSEKDRRSVGSELKVRVEDLKAQEIKVERFKDFDKVEEQLEDLVEQKKRLSKELLEFQKVKGLYERLKACRDNVRGFDGFDPNILPDKEKISRIQRATTLVRTLNGRYKKAQLQFQKYTGFSVYELPREERVVGIKAKIQELQKLRLSYIHHKDKVQVYSSFKIPELPTEVCILEKIQTRNKARGFAQVLHKNKNTLTEYITMEENLISKQEMVLSVVSTLLGDLGECPVCKAPHGGSC